MIIKINVKFVEVEFLMLIKLMLSMLLNEAKSRNSMLNFDMKNARNTKKFEIENVDLKMFNIEIKKKLKCEKLNLFFYCKR